MHPREVSHLDVHCSANELVARDQAQLSALCVPAGEFDDAMLDLLEIERYDPVRSLDYEIVDGDRLPLVGRDVHAIWTPGYADGHLSLVEVDNAVVLTGGHVLPRISPYVGMLDATLHDRNLIEIVATTSKPGYARPRTRGRGAAATGLYQTSLTVW